MADACAVGKRLEHGMGMKSRHSRHIIARIGTQVEIPLFAQAQAEDTGNRFTD